MLSDEHKARKAAKRNAAAPKSLSGVLSSLTDNQLTMPQKKEIAGPSFKARCVRLANKSVFIGHTHFKFDENGLMEMKPNGRHSQGHDFQLLLKKPGVEEVKEAPIFVPTFTVPVEAPEEVTPDLTYSISVETTPSVESTFEVVDEIKNIPVKTGFSKRSKKKNKENE